MVTTVRINVSLSCLWFLLIYGIAGAQQSPIQEKYRIDLSDPTDRVLIAKFSPDDSKILFVNQKSTQIWSAQTGKLLVTFPEPMRVDYGFEISWQPGGSKILQHYADSLRKRPAVLWDGETGQRLATLEEEAGVIGAEWNSEGDRILSVGNYVGSSWVNDFTFSVRDENGRVIRSERHKQYGFHAITLSATGDKVIVSQEPRRNGKPIEVFDRDSGRLLQGFDHDLPKLNSLLYPIFVGESPDGKYLCGEIDGSKGIVCWRSADGKPIYYFLDTKETGDNVFLSFSGDSQRLAILRSRQKKIDIADAATGRVQFSIAGMKTVYQASVAAMNRSFLPGFEYSDLWSPDGNEFVATDVENQVSLWNLNSGQMISKRPAIWNSDYDWFVGDLPTDYEIFKFNPRRKLLLSVSNQVVRIWDPVNGELLKEIVFPYTKKGDNVRERYVATWSPDGELLTTAANNNRTLIVWTVEK